MIITLECGFFKEENEHYVLAKPGCLEGVAGKVLWRGDRQPSREILNLIAASVEYGLQAGKYAIPKKVRFNHL